MSSTDYEGPFRIKDPDHGFRPVLRRQNSMVGTFVKTPAYQVVEVLAGTSLDFVVLDAEHAPFGRAEIDVGCLAGRAWGFPVLVRTPDGSAASILQALDCGANGILVPHVNSVRQAQEAVAAARYREDNGSRGFSPSARAGAYGAAGMQSHLQNSDRNVAVVVQIETAQAVDAVHEIAAVSGVDALFIGRADLAVSYGVDDLNHPEVSKAVERICEAGRSANLVVSMFLPDASSMGHFRQLGVNMFILGSDQSYLQKMVASMTQD